MEVKENYDKGVEYFEKRVEDVLFRSKCTWEVCCDEREEPRRGRSGSEERQMIN